MMRTGSFVLTIALALGACSEGTLQPRQRETSLHELGLNPDRFPLGQEVNITGWLIEPPRSVLFVCDEISSESPPRAIGSCSEVENEELLRSEDAVSRGATTWIPEAVTLTCEVTGYRPTVVRPERLALTCNPD